MTLSNFTIYMHTAPNGKRYVGITSKDPDERWKNGNGYVANKHFSAAIKLYGWDNIRHDIIASDIPQEEAEKMERELIAKYQSDDRKYGYNILPGGNSSAGGWKHTEENKKKISQASKLYSATPKAKANAHKLGVQKRKEISVYDIYGKHLMDCISAKAAEALTGVANSNIIACCRGRYNSMNGYIFRYKEDGRCVKPYRGKRIPVCQFSIEGEYIRTFKSAKEAADSVGVHGLHVTSACKFKSASSGGYLWLYETETNRIEEKVAQYNNLSRHKALKKEA